MALAKECNNCPQDSKFRYKLIHTNGHESEEVIINIKTVVNSSPSTNTLPLVKDKTLTEDIKPNSFDCFDGKIEAEFYDRTLVKEWLDAGVSGTKMNIIFTEVEGAELVDSTDTPVELNTRLALLPRIRKLVTECSDCHCEPQQITLRYKLVNTQTNEESNEATFSVYTKNRVEVIGDTVEVDPEKFDILLGGTTNFSTSEEDGEKYFTNSAVPDSGPNSHNIGTFIKLKISPDISLSGSKFYIEDQFGDTYNEYDDPYNTKHQEGELNVDYIRDVNGNEVGESDSGFIYVNGSEIQDGTILFLQVPSIPDSIGKYHFFVGVLEMADGSKYKTKVLHSQMEDPHEIYSI